jgi:demethylsterigmatocystin 6-O-methyltransferase
MGEDSMILIDKMILPDSNVHWEATQIDLTMMSSVAARERTIGAWKELLESVGLVIEGVWTYTPSVHESVMTIKRK